MLGSHGSGLKINAPRTSETSVRSTRLHGVTPEDSSNFYRLQMLSAAFLALIWWCERSFLINSSLIMSGCIWYSKFVSLLTLGYVSLSYPVKRCPCLRWNLITWTRHTYKVIWNSVQKLENNKAFCVDSNQKLFCSNIISHLHKGHQNKNTVNRYATEI
jgi:hypothetical protein